MFLRDLEESARLIASCDFVGREFRQAIGTRLSSRELDNQDPLSEERMAVASDDWRTMNAPDVRKGHAAGQAVVAPDDKGDPPTG